MRTQKQSETGNNGKAGAVRRAESLREFADSLGLGFDTVYRRAQSGELKTIRFGRRILVPFEEIQRVSRERL